MDDRLLIHNVSLPQDTGIYQPHKPTRLTDHRLTVLLQLSSYRII